MENNKTKYLIYPFELLDELTPNELLVLSQLAYLKKSFNTITASNDFFSSKLRISVPTVSRAVRTLERLNYIIVHYNSQVKKNTKRVILLTQKTLIIYNLGKTTFSSNKTRKKKSEALKQFLNE